MTKAWKKFIVQNLKFVFEQFLSVVLEQRPNDAEKLEQRLDDAEKLEQRPDDVEKLEQRPDDAEKLEQRPDDGEKLEQRPDDAEKLEERPDDAEKLEIKLTAFDAKFNDDLRNSLATILRGIFELKEMLQGGDFIHAGLQFTPASNYSRISMTTSSSLM